MASVLSQGFGDNTASVRIHFCIDPKWAVHILDHICPWPSLPRTTLSCLAMGATECVQGAGMPGSNTLASDLGKGGKVDPAPLVEGGSHRVEVREEQARGN